jgi:3-oxoacyl-[acyl-carrier protein] reductase
MEKEKSLSGKVAWVTGSSRGIGRSIVEYLAESGANVVVHGTRQDSPKQLNEGDTLDSIAAGLKEKYGVEAIGAPGDLTDDNVVRGIVDQIHESLGPIDIQVNCAGGDIGHTGVTGDLAGRPKHNDGVFVSLEDIHAVLDRNILSCIYCCRAVAPEMMERKSGRIINFGSVAGCGGVEAGIIYASAKAAVHEYTRCLALQLRPFDVTVNAIAPGSIITNRILASRDMEDAMMMKSGTQVRYGWPIEISRAVEFLVSEKNTYITGQILRVDGGLQTWPA